MVYVKNERKHSKSRRARGHRQILEGCCGHDPWHAGRRRCLLFPCAEQTDHRNHLRPFDCPFGNRRGLLRRADQSLAFRRDHQCDTFGFGLVPHRRGIRSQNSLYSYDSRSVDGFLGMGHALRGTHGARHHIGDGRHLVSDPTGFDHWDILVGQGDYYNPTFIRDGERVCREGYATNIITDLALEWLDKERDKDRPFCLFVHHKAPHRTWMPDLCDLELFSDAEFPLPDNFYDEYDGRIPASLQEMSVVKDMDLVYDLKLADKENEIHTSTGLEQAGRSLYDRFTPAQKKVWDAHYDPIIEEFKRQGLYGDALARWKYRQYMRDYLRVIHSVDRNVGRLLDYLESNGLMDNTMIVYTSDQGFYMGEHGWFDKRFMYEESFRTPLLVRIPGGRKGDIEELVQNIDYAPTILEFAGVDVPEDMHGVSFLPLLEGGKTEDWRNSIYYHYYEYPAEHAVRKHFGIRTDRYKLIRFYGDINCWELYDLLEDPSEMHNLYGVPGSESLTDSLRTELLRLQILYDDPIREIPLP